MPTYYRLRNEGASGFLNPLGHPEHTWSVTENRGGHAVGWFSLSAAAEAEWIPAEDRRVAQAKLAEWVPLPLDSPEVVKWFRSVLGYFAGCYKGEGKEPWNAGNLRSIAP